MKKQCAAVLHVSRDHCDLPVPVSFFIDKTQDLTGGPLRLARRILALHHPDPLRHLRVFRPVIAQKVLLQKAQFRLTGEPGAFRQEMVLSRSQAIPDTHLPDLSCHLRAHTEKFFLSALPVWADPASQCHVEGDLVRHQEKLFDQGVLHRGKAGKGIKKEHCAAEKTALLRHSGKDMQHLFCGKRPVPYRVIKSFVEKREIRQLHAERQAQIRRCCLFQVLRLYAILVEL